MKLVTGIATLLTITSIQAFAKPPVVSAPMNSICSEALQAAASILGDGLDTDENGNHSVDSRNMEQIKISNVKTLESSCHGPADCDDQNPDTFTWSADIGDASSIHGKAVVSYHRGTCFVKRVSFVKGK